MHLVFDASQGRRDTYGRLLAYLILPGGGDFGLTMIERGHATEYTYNDDRYRRQRGYQAAERRARIANRGLWSECGAEGGGRVAVIPAIVTAIGYRRGTSNPSTERGRRRR